MLMGSVIVGRADVTWIVNGPTPGIAKMIWSGMEGAALGMALARMIAWRSEPGPESFVLVTPNVAAEMPPARFFEKADVSPVPTFVAVAVTSVPTGTLPETEVRMIAGPPASVVTAVEPISVAPWPGWPAVPAGFEKNWMRKVVPGVLWS